MSSISIHNMLETKAKILSLYASVPKDWNLVRIILGTLSQRSVNLQCYEKIDFVGVLEDFWITSFQEPFYILFIYLAVPGTKPRSLHMVDKRSITELYTRAA